MVLAAMRAAGARVWRALLRVPHSRAEWRFIGRTLLLSYAAAAPLLLLQGADGDESAAAIAGRPEAPRPSPPLVVRWEPVKPASLAVRVAAVAAVVPCLAEELLFRVLPIPAPAPPGASAALQAAVARRRALASCGSLAAYVAYHPLQALSECKRRDPPPTRHSLCCWS